MLVTEVEASNMLCPFKFSNPELVSAPDMKTGRKSPVWRCEGARCMAWQKVVSPVRGENGYCGLSAKPT
jgi:hypothetical protein